MQKHEHEINIITKRQLTMENDNNKLLEPYFDTSIIWSPYEEIWKIQDHRILTQPTLGFLLELKDWLFFDG